MTDRARAKCNGTVPPSTSPEFRDLTRHARSLGIHLEPAHLEKIRTYVAELLRWNRKINLTSTTDLHGILNEHVLDSLVAAGQIGAVKVLVDVGAGAGFPGIPIKIVKPETVVVFIESRRKKASFLQRAIRLLRMSGCDVIWGRAEDESVKARLMAEAADAIITRAAVKDEVALDLVAALATRKKRVFLMKGDLAESQRSSLEALANERGSRVSGFFLYMLPGMSKQRNLVTIEWT